jgi:hypothetical protein
MKFSSQFQPRSNRLHWGFVIFTIGLFLALFSAPLAGQSSQLAYWRLDEANGPLYVDLFGENDATCVGDCPIAIAGQVGGGQHFNGSSGLESSFNAALNWAAGDSFSVELWVQGTAGQTCADSAETMIGRVDLATGMRWSLGCASATGNATFHLFDESGQGITLEGPAIHNGGWHHIVGVRDGANNRNILYVNGKEVAAVPITYAAGFAASTNVNIGWLNLDAGYHFEGVLDEIALYSRVLTPTEIGSHYYLSRGYTELCTAPIRIMPLGDSITQGHNSGVNDLDKQIAYRRDLWHSLRSSGYQVDFVGSLINGESYQPLDGFDPDHEGHSGERDDRVARYIYNWLTANPADVILLHIGTNALDPDPGDIERLLNEVDLYDESITVLLARIINRRTYSATTTEFNNNVEAMARARIVNGDKILIVDMENGAGIDYSQYPPGDMWDTVHPYATGYTKMAHLWLNTLNEWMPVCANNSPVFTSAPVIEAMAGQPYSYQADASGYPALSFTLITFPTGMSIDAATGLISWTPSVVGAFDVTVEASNSAGTNSQSFVINVDESPQAPVITSEPVTAATIGQGYRYDVEATGNPSPTFGLTTAPAGMTIDPATGLIDWTPSTTGDYEVVVEAINSSGTTSQSFTINVLEHTSAPVITSLPVTTAGIGEPYSYQLEASGNPAPAFSLIVAPPGMSIDAAIGLVTWTPATEGIFDVTVSAANSAGTDEQSFAITVQDSRQGTMCPVDMISYWPMDEGAGSTLFNDIQSGYNGSCTGAACPTSVNGQIAGAFSFDGNDKVDVPYQTAFEWENTDSFSVELWMNTAQSCSGNKVFIGRHTNSVAWWVGCSSSGNAFFSLRDSHKKSVNIGGTTKINNGNWHHLVAVYNGSSRQNLLYVNGQLEASNPTSYSGNFISNSNLNLGYYINGYFYNGIMDEIAIYHRVLDANEIGQHYANGAAGQSYCTVTETGDPPAIISEPVTTGTAGQPYSYDVEASGNPVPSFALTVSPDGITIDATTGLVAWTPNVAGTFDVTVEAVNSAGVDSQSFAITVSDPAQAPTITSEPVTAATTGQLYSYDVEANGNPAPSFALLVAPTGMTIDATTGVISWTPDTAGSFDVTVDATNSAGMVSQSFTITVVEPVSEPPAFLSSPVVALVGQLYQYQAQAGGTPPPLYSLTIAPEGMSIDPDTGLIEWTPEMLGIFNVTIIAENRGGTTSQSFPIQVVTAMSTARSISAPEELTIGQLWLPVITTD